MRGPKIDEHREAGAAGDGMHHAARRRRHDSRGSCTIQPAGCQPQAASMIQVTEPEHDGDQPERAGLHARSMIEPETIGGRRPGRTAGKLPEEDAVEARPQG